MRHRSMFTALVSLLACARAGEDGPPSAAEAKTADPEKRALGLPVTLGKLDVTAVAGTLPGRTSLRLDTTATLNRSLDATMFVGAKAVCRHDARAIADVQRIEITEVKNMNDFVVGQAAPIRGQLFVDVWSEQMAHCQLDFNLDSRVSDDPGIPLGTACWQGGAVTTGPCSPSLVTATAPEPDPLAVVEVSVAAAPEHTLAIDVLLDVQAEREHLPATLVKSACPVDGVALVDVRELAVKQDSFRFAPGESLRRTTRLYAPEGFGVTAPLDGCDITVAGDEAGHLLPTRTLAHVCWRGGVVEHNPCTPPKPTPPAAMLIAPGAVTVSNIVIRERPYGPGAYYVELRLDLTVVEPVTRESAVSQTRLSCTSGGKMFDADLFVEIANRSSDRDSFSLHMLAPGETLRVGSNAFIETPLPAPPDRCDLRLTASALRSEVAFEVARFCVTKGEAVAGACSETR